MECSCRLRQRRRVRNRSDVPASMATPRHLNRAPIREGLINIQFEPVSMEVVKSFGDQIAPRYASGLDIWSHDFAVEVGKVELAKHERSALGRRFDGPNEGPPHVVLVQRSEFTYSRLEPYTDWEELRGAAKPLWEQFVRAARPQRVTRVAVRFVNAMQLPIKHGDDFSKYLEASPQIPPNLPQTASAFLQRIVIGDQATGNIAIITQAFEGMDAAAPPEITVLFDIDAFRPCASAPDSDDIWTVLDSLREFKNDIFFKHLTEAAVDLFE